MTPTFATQGTLNQILCILVHHERPGDFYKKKTLGGCPPHAQDAIVPTRMTLWILGDPNLNLHLPLESCEGGTTEEKKQNSNQKHDDFCVITLPNHDFVWNIFGTNHQTFRTKSNEFSLVVTRWFKPWPVYPLGSPNLSKRSRHKRRIRQILLNISGIGIGGL